MHVSISIAEYQFSLELIWLIYGRMQDVQGMGGKRVVWKMLTLTMVNNYSL